MRNTLWIGAPAILMLCSCASSPRVADIDADRPSLRPGALNRAAETRPVSRDVADDSTDIRGQSPDFPEAPPAGDEGVVRVNFATSAPVSRAGHHRRRNDATFTPAEPRGPVDCPVDCYGQSSSCPPGAPCAPHAMSAYPGPYGRRPMPYGPPRGAGMHGAVPPISYPRLYPDEYVCDGGDSGYPVTYDNVYRQGLETEDTIAEYVDSDGTFRMKPSTKVCIYAPRFGAMRTVTGPQADTSIRRVAAANETTYGSSVRNRDAVQYHNQRRGIDRMLVRSRPSGLIGDQALLGTQQFTAIESHTKLINTYQDISFLRTGYFVSTEEAWIADRIQAAVAWNRNENPVVAAKTTGGQQVTARFKPMEIIGIESRRTKGQLRIVKLADKKTAVPGDEVTFTIRYDNLGDQSLTQVRIVDNLSPRLEYVDDSATSDRAGEVTVEDNGEGSVLLTIDLDEPLKGHTGGVITFKTIVR